MLQLIPIVVSSGSSSESEEPSTVPVVPSFSTAANSSSPTPSLLERLQALQQSELSCMQVVRHNSGTSSIRKKKPSCSTDPKSVARVHEFPNESLKVSAGKLFCSTCREVSLKCSIISNHVTKHKQGKLKWLRRIVGSSRESDIADNEHNLSIIGTFHEHNRLSPNSLTPHHMYTTPLNSAQ